MAKSFIDVDALVEHLHKRYCIPCLKYEHSRSRCSICKINLCLDIVADAPTTDVAEVEKISEQIIRKNAEVTEYWKNDVKQYRALKGYSDIEHDADNFLRGYNEAVEDMLTILDGAIMNGDEDDL